MLYKSCKSMFDSVKTLLNCEQYGGTTIKKYILLISVGIITSTVLAPAIVKVRGSIEYTYILLINAIIWSDGLFNIFLKDLNIKYFLYTAPIVTVMKIVVLVLYSTDLLPMLWFLVSYEIIGLLTVCCYAVIMVKLIAYIKDSMSVSTYENYCHTVSFYSAISKLVGVGVGLVVGYMLQDQLSYIILVACGIEAIVLILEVLFIRHIYLYVFKS